MRNVDVQSLHGSSRVP